METEYEVKILDIDTDNVIKLLKKIGATKIAERCMRRYVYDLKLDKENKCGKWIRLRDNGEKVTLAVKDIIHKGIDGTKEIEVEVKDFEKTNKLIKEIGFSPQSYQENKRVSYKLGDIDFEIDTWPKIPSYLEIEGKSIEDVKKAVQLLGFKMEDTTSIGVTDVFKKYGLDINKFKELKF